MGGVGGGLLNLVEIIGGGVLFILRCVIYVLIGKAAWKFAGDRFDRLLAGCIGVGLLIGTILYTWVVGDVYAGGSVSDKVTAKIAVCFIVPTVVFGIFIALLDALRAALEKKKD